MKEKVSLVLLGLLVFGFMGVGRELVEVHYYPAWIDHWENAGPLVAIALGFYEEVGLDVRDFPGGPELNPLERMVNDRAIAFATSYNWLVLKVRLEQEVPLVVIATDFQNPALHLVSWLPIEKPSDLFGKRVEVWPGYDYPLRCFLGKEQDRVLIENQGAEMGRFFERRVDASHAMIYNELLTVLHHYGFEGIQAYYQASEETWAEKQRFYIYRFGELDEELAWDENSLVTTEDVFYNHPDVVQRFITATYRGWYWVMTHDPEKVFEILLQSNSTLIERKDLEIAGGIEINKLMINANTRHYGLGYMDPEPWVNMAERLFEAGLLERMPSVSEILALYHPVASGVFPPE